MRLGVGMGVGMGVGVLLHGHALITGNAPILITITMHIVTVHIHAAMPTMSTMPTMVHVVVMAVLILLAHALAHALAQLSGGGGIICHSITQPLHTIMVIAIEHDIVKVFNLSHEA